MLKFRFAKTLAHIPHEYTIYTAETADEFKALAATIRRGGVWEMWNGKRFKYWYDGGFKYWHMGVCINRTRVEDPEEYFAEQIAAAQR